MKRTVDNYFFFVIDLVGNRGRRLRSSSRSGLEMMASTVMFMAAKARPTSWDCSIPSLSSGRLASFRGFNFGSPALA